MSNRRLYLLFHGRYPSEKAAGLFVNESARAYAAHLPVTVIVPWRRGRAPEVPSHGIAVKYLSNIDLFGVPILGSFAFPFSYFLFSISAIFYLIARVHGDDIVETNEVLPALLATLLSRNVVYELHDFPEHALWLYRAMLRRVRFVIATNEWKKKALIEQFGIEPSKIIMERNGVDVDRFAPQDRIAARAKLGLPVDVRIVLYTGHLYGWKGVDTLAQAAPLVPDVQFYFVGGTDHDIAKFKEKFGAVPNIHIVGFRPHDEMPLWQASADVLVLPNTAKEEISAHYTSPMKLFEYMASARPIVASNLPSIAEVLPADAGYLVEPDSPQALAAGIREALADPAEAAARGQIAKSAVVEFAWDRRARRLLAHFAQPGA